MSRLRRYLPLLTIAFAIGALYLYRLGGVGVLSTDEPRYAAIGRAMAFNGDLITPRLWGSPWFEKPPLLYWMTALATAAGLGPELSARLPVALLSLAFLVIAVWLVSREFGRERALFSIALLATSACWITFSDLSVTDLPLAVFFSLAVLLALPLLREEPDHSREAQRFLAMGACLGLAALAKGLVPFALALPFFWFLRPFWRRWWLAGASCAVVALPWYSLVYARNGYPFIQEFFVRHHLERLYSSSLRHVQPWYYYVPVLLLALFPWTPLLGLLWGIKRWDPRQRFLAAVVLWGFFFFSLSLNKLPGYLLPLIPSLFLLLASRFEANRLPAVSKGWLIACAVLIGTLPLLAAALPGWLIAGRFSFSTATIVSKTAWFYAVAPLLVVLLARRQWVGPLLLLSIAAGGLYFKTVTFPILDQRVSARGLWLKYRGLWPNVCDGGTPRDWIYGLSFYQQSFIRPCTEDPRPFALHASGHEFPVVTPR